jgi:hypothetical protein
LSGGFIIFVFDAEELEGPMEKGRVSSDLSDG